LYIIQDKHYDNAYKASYLYQASSMIGTIIASGMVAFILWSNNYHLWRWCFLISGLVCIIAYILRISDSTNHNKLLFKKQTFELKLKQYIVPISAIAFSTGLSHITYAIPCIVMNSLIPLICDITLAEMMELNTVLLGVDMILIFVCGHILRKIHYNYIMIFSSLILMITVPILFVFLPDSDLWYITFVRIWIIFLGVIFMCPQNLYYFNIMNLSLDTKNNKNNQYLVAGIANALGAGIIGRTVPALSMWIWYITDNVTYIAAYIAIIAFMTTIFITMTANMPRN
jgi:MFS family permease